MIRHRLDRSSMAYRLCFYQARARPGQPRTQSTPPNVPAHASE